MLVQAFLCELLKLRRARITWIVTAVYAFAPLMLGLMMTVLMRPALGRRMGLLTAKAELTIGAANWPTYLTLTAALFAGGLIVLAVVEAFVFGREYAEGTAKNLLTLPVDRATLVAAKFAVSAVWFVAMAAVVYAVALAVGFAIGLPGFQGALLVGSHRQRRLRPALGDDHPRRRCRPDGAAGARHRPRLRVGRVAARPGAPAPRRPRHSHPPHRQHRPARAAGARARDRGGRLALRVPGR